jgi:hypothetical protein
MTNSANNGKQSAANEFGRLAQGIKGRVEFTDTIDFIHFPRETKGQEGYLWTRRLHCPPPEERTKPHPHHSRGNLIDYPGDVSTQTANLTTFKTHLNSVISTPGAKYMCMDVGNFYLMTPLDEPEYMRFHISLIPDEIIEAYDLTKSSHRWFCVHPYQKGYVWSAPKPAFCPTNFSVNVLHHMDTMNALTHQVCGNTKHDLSRSHLLLMTLASNTSTRKMHNTLNESSDALLCHMRLGR